MDIHYATLETCPDATGVVVVIDVIRAYTTAAFGLAAGARQILLTEMVEEALALRAHFPAALVMGEVNGRPPEGFDFGNSPAALAGLDLTGRTLILRTTAGTPGAVRAQRASALFGSCFATAAATVRAVRALAPEAVTLVATGLRPEDSAEEDLACADYLAALLRGETPEPTPYLERARRSEAAKKFFDPAIPDFSPADIDCCLDLDCFDFAMRIERRDGLLVIQGR